MNKIRHLIFVIVVLLFANNLYSKEKKIYSSKDSYGDSQTPTYIAGDAYTLLIANRKSIEEYASSYLYFDLSSIPNDAIIESAHLYMYCITEFGTANIRIGRSYESWSESSLNYNNMPSHITPPAFAYYSVKENSWNNYNVKEWIKTWIDGTYKNYGFGLFTNNSESASVWESSESTNKPYIIVEYTEKVTIGNLKIQVNNARGIPQANAKVILYQKDGDSWAESSKYTDSSGETSYWELDAGKYNAEVYYDGGGGNEFWVSAWDDYEGAITLNAGDSKTYTMQRNEPYAYDYRVFDDTGNEITGEEIPVGTTVTHRVYVTNTSSTDREVMVKICSNNDKNTDWNYSSNAVEIASNSNLSFDLEQTIEESGTYYRKVKVETLVHSYTQTDWWNWDTSVTGKEKVAANISIDPISSVTRGVQFKVTCNVTNNGSSSRTFNVGAEIKDGETKLYPFAARETPIIGAGQTEQVSYYYTIPDDWELKEYTFNAAVWDGTPGSGEWLAGDDLIFSVNNPDDAQIIDFIVPTGTVQRESIQQIKVKVKNTGTTARSFWIGLSIAHETTSGDNWPYGWYDIIPQKTQIINSGDEATVTFSFAIPEYWRSGQYYAVAAIWEDFNPETYLMVEPKFDYTLWHQTQFENPDIGKKTFYLSKVTFNNTYESNFVVGNILREITHKSITDLYLNGEKPFMRMNFIKGSVPIMKIPFLGNIEYGAASCGMYIDLADYLSITPEGQEGYTTIWLDLEMKGATININNPIDLPITLFLKEIDLNANGSLDKKEDELKFLTGQFLGIAFTGFTWDGEHLSGPQAKIGGTISGNKLINISVEKGTNILYKVEIKTELLDHMFTNALVSGQSEFIKNTIFLYNFYLQFKSYIENPELFKDFTYDDGDWELTNGTSRNGLHMELLPEQIENSANWFYINVPEDCKKMTIRTYGGDGELSIFHKFNQRPILRGVLDYDNKAFVDNATNQELIIENPLSGKHFFALRVQSEGFYKDVSVIANYEIENNTKIIAIIPDDSWNYGDVTIDNSSDKTFLLQNKGSTDLSISDITISGTNSNQFEILSPASTSFDIASQASIEVKVRFSPTSSGSKSAQLEIFNNSDNASPIKTIALNGTGTEVQTFAITSSVNPSEGGTVMGDGNYELGKTCNLTATPESGYVFLNWTEDGTQVSNDEEYSFEVTEDRVLVANFKLSTVTLDSVTISGVTSVIGNSSASYTCTANYSNGSTEDVTSSASWSVSPSTYATIGNSTGVLRTSSVSSDESCTITVSYEGKSNIYNVTIIDVTNNLQNVALSSNGGVASAISEGSYSGVKHYAYLANDGDNTSAWTSQWSMPAWLIIKFDKSYLINKVGVLWGAGTHNQDYSISLSSDGNSWTTVVPSRSSNTDSGYTDGIYHGTTNDSHEMFDISPMNAKYIKIDITNTSAPASHIFQAIVHELEAYATNNNPATLVNEQEQNKVQVYPNPTTGIVQIEGLPTAKETSLSIYSLQSKLITQKVVSTSQTSIDISKQVSGTYLLIINNDQSHAVKIIKE